MKENEIKVNTLAKVHLVEIEDIKKQSNVYVRELTKLRKENFELKHSLHEFKEFCDTTLAQKDEEIKQTNMDKNSKIDKLTKENTQRLLIKEEQIVELNQEVEEHKNKYKEYTTKLEKYIEMSKKGITVKETDKTTIILNANGEEI